jgi:hypothetical protein
MRRGGFGVCKLDIANTLSLDNKLKTMRQEKIHNISKSNENSMMTLDRRKNDAIDALAKLADGMDGKSETAKIREVIDFVELALSSGVSREKVFDTLRESLGIKMSFRTFETTLHRIRKERKQKDTEQQNNSPVSIAVLNTNNQLFSNSNNLAKNTDIVVIDSASQSTAMALVNIDDDDKENENWEPKSSELEYRENLNKPVDIVAISEMTEMLKAVKREEKIIKREQAKLNNKPSY